MNKREILNNISKDLSTMQSGKKQYVFGLVKVTVSRPLTSTERSRRAKKA